MSVTPPPTYFQPTPPAHVPAPRRTGRIVLAVGLAGFLLLCGIGALVSMLRTPPAAPDVPTDPPAARFTTMPAAPQGSAPSTEPTTPPATPPAAKGITSGTWEVGSEVKPGTYTTVSQGPCYWARLKNFDGALTSIIANGNLDDGQKGRIAVKASDAGIEFIGECVWTKK